MSANHVMVSESKSLCGRQVTQGTGADCKNCARVSDVRDRRAGVIAEVVRDDLVRATRSAIANPPAWLAAQPEIAMDGRPVVEHDDNGKITSAVIAVDGILAMFRVVIGATLVDRYGQVYLMGDVTSEHVWYSATDGAGVWTHADLLNMLDSGELSTDKPTPLTAFDDDSFSPDGRTLAEVIADGDMMPSKPITFDDVKEANGWMSTDVDDVTRTLPAGTEVKPGMWNCCQSKPAVAVQFTSEESGGHVYYQGCRSCASTVPVERLAKLPETLAEYDARTLAQRQARREVEQSECNGDDGYREPAAIVLVGEQISTLVELVQVMGYRTAANSDGRMSLARNSRPTVEGFNADYGYQCKTWADVRAVLIAAGVKGVKP